MPGVEPEQVCNGLAACDLSKCWEDRLGEGSHE